MDAFLQIPRAGPLGGPAAPAPSLSDGKPLFPGPCPPDPSRLLGHSPAASPCQLPSSAGTLVTRDPRQQVRKEPPPDTGEVADQTELPRSGPGVASTRCCRLSGPGSTLRWPSGRVWGLPPAAPRPASHTQTRRGASLPGGRAGGRGSSPGSSCPLTSLTLPLKGHFCRQLLKFSASKLPRAGISRGECKLSAPQARAEGDTGLTASCRVDIATGSRFVPGSALTTRNSRKVPGFQPPSCGVGRTLQGCLVPWQRSESSLPWLPGVSQAWRKGAPSLRGAHALGRTWRPCPRGRGASGLWEEVGVRVEGAAQDLGLRCGCCWEALTLGGPSLRASVACTEGGGRRQSR